MKFYYPKRNQYKILFGKEKYIHSFYVLVDNESIMFKSMKY